MIGAIIGDIVGSVYEFNNTKDYDFKLFSEDSDITDDTIMTIAVAEWALRCKRKADFDLKSLEEIMVSTAERYPSPKGDYGMAFSTWLFYPQGLIDYRTGELAGKRCPYNSWGNGSAMRVSSIGWLFDSIEETEQVAATSASITHNHPEGIKGAEAVAAAIFLARNGASKKEIKEYIESKYEYNLDSTWEYLNKTYSWDSSCQGTVPQAIICFLDSSDFESAIRMSVSIGGDSDTLACITGSIAEAYYKDIPNSMISVTSAIMPEEYNAVLKQLAENSNYAEVYSKYFSK